MNRYIKLSAFLLALGGLSSCDLGGEPDIDGTATRKMAGEWYLQLTDGDHNVLVDYSLFTTSNTAANVASEMWFVDHNVFGAQSKISTDQNALTFSSSNSANADYGPGAAPAGKPVVAIGTTRNVDSAVPESITITDGKILKDAVTPPSNTKTDSMVLNITGNYHRDVYAATGYNIVDIEGVPDTTVIWQIQSSTTLPDGPYILTGYRRTGFLEDEH